MYIVLVKSFSSFSSQSINVTLCQEKGEVVGILVLVVPNTLSSSSMVLMTSQRLSLPWGNGMGAE